jgi:hypothetical protein
MDTLLYYKVHDSSSAISCRIDSTLDESLLVPLLSVFNESDLYSTWMPSWRHPKLGVRKSEKLKEMGRGHQVIQVRLCATLLLWIARTVPAFRTNPIFRLLVVLHVRCP